MYIMLLRYIALRFQLLHLMRLTDQPIANVQEKQK